MTMHLQQKDPLSRSGHGTVTGLEVGNQFQMPTATVEVHVDGAVRGKIRFTTNRPEGALGGTWRVEVPRGAMIDGDLHIGVEPVNGDGAPVAGGLSKHRVVFDDGVRTHGDVMVLFRGSRVTFEDCVVRLRGPRPEDVTVETNQPWQAFWNYGATLVVVIGDAVKEGDLPELTKSAE